MRRLLRFLAATTAIATVASLFHSFETTIPLGKQGALLVGADAGTVRFIGIDPDRSSVPVPAAAIDAFARDLLAASALSKPIFRGEKFLYEGTWITAHRLADVHLPTIFVSLVVVLLLHAAIQDRRRFLRALSQIRRPSPSRQSLLLRCVNRVVVVSCIALAATCCVGWLRSYKGLSISSTSYPGRYSSGHKIAASVTLLEQRAGSLNVCASVTHGALCISGHRVRPDGSAYFFDPAPLVMESRVEAGASRGWLTSVRCIGNHDGFAIRCSCGLALVVLLTWPIVAFIIGPWRRAARDPGFCEKCGYNLTGLPEPRCPECGTDVKYGNVGAGP